MSFFNFSLFFLLVIVGKTREFTIFLEYAQNIVLLKYINFYFGFGLEFLFNDFELFFGKFIEISHESQLGNFDPLPTKLKILTNFQLNLANNLGEILIIFIFAVFSLFFLTLLRHKFNFDEKGLFALALNKIQLPFFARFLDFIVLPVFFYSFLEIAYNPRKTFDDHANFIMALSILAIYVIFIVKIVKILNFHSPSGDYLKKYEVLIEKLRLGEVLSRNYLVFRFCIKILMAGALVVFMGNFRTQLVTISALLTVKILFLMFFKPYVNNCNNLFEFISTGVSMMFYLALSYTSFDLEHLEGIRLVILSAVFFCFLFNSLPIYYALMLNSAKIKENLSNFPFALGISVKRKHFFIDFEEKPSQNTKANITKEQKQYDDFFRNPSPEISELSQEIAKINLGNYLQTELKENEKFENRDKKKRFINLVSKSFTTRESFASCKSKNSGELSYSQRIDEEKQAGTLPKKGRTARTFKEFFTKK